MDAATDTNLTGRQRRAKTPDPRVLLAWYDLERRALPWRAAPGERPDPYRVWLSEIMLQQTRAETVARYFVKFVARWPDVDALAAAPLAEVLSAWAGLGYYARARNLHACAREVVARHDGRFPDTEAELRALPGIGGYTAAAIAAIVFGRRAVPMDGNVERVVARVFAFGKSLPKAKGELRHIASGLASEDRPGDFAQALMDLGATVCTPRRPDCARCPWQQGCAGRRRGNPERFPRLAPKRNGMLRRGAAFVVLRDDRRLLVRTRSPRGLLGGMTEVPTSEWSSEFDHARALEFAPHLPSPRERERAVGRAARLRLAGGREEITWRRLPGMVRHVFTHFPLELTVYVASERPGTRAPRGMRFVPMAALGSEALPTLMRKVIAHALAARDHGNDRRKQ
jgi:A/G-specific adenine glycosylase